MTDFQYTDNTDKVYIIIDLHGSLNGNFFLVTRENMHISYSGFVGSIYNFCKIKKKYKDAVNYYNETETSNTFEYGSIIPDITLSHKGAKDNTLGIINVREILNNNKQEFNRETKELKNEIQQEKKDDIPDPYYDPEDEAEDTSMRSKILRSFKKVKQNIPGSKKITEKLDKASGGKLTALAQSEKSKKLAGLRKRSMEKISGLRKSSKERLERLKKRTSEGLKKKKEYFESVRKKSYEKMKQKTPKRLKSLAKRLPKRTKSTPEESEDDDDPDKSVITEGADRLKNNSISFIYPALEINSPMTLSDVLRVLYQMYKDKQIYVKVTACLGIENSNDPYINCMFNLHRFPKGKTFQIKSSGIRLTKPDIPIYGFQIPKSIVYNKGKINFPKKIPKYVLKEEHLVNIIEYGEQDSGYSLFLLSSGYNNKELERYFKNIFNNTPITVNNIKNYFQPPPALIKFVFINKRSKLKVVEYLVVQMTENLKPIVNLIARNIIEAKKKNIGKDVKKLLPNKELIERIQKSASYQDPSLNSKTPMSLNQLKYKHNDEYELELEHIVFYYPTNITEKEFITLPLKPKDRLTDTKTIQYNQFFNINIIDVVEKLTERFDYQTDNPFIIKLIEIFQKILDSIGNEEVECNDLGPNPTQPKQPNVLRIILNRYKMCPPLYYIKKMNGCLLIVLNNVIDQNGDININNLNVYLYYYKDNKDFEYIYNILVILKCLYSIDKTDTAPGTDKYIGKCETVVDIHSPQYKDMLLRLEQIDPTSAFGLLLAFGLIKERYESN